MGIVIGLYRVTSSEISWLWVLGQYGLIWCGGFDFNKEFVSVIQRWVDSMLAELIAVNSVRPVGTTRWCHSRSTVERQVIMLCRYWLRRARIIHEAGAIAETVAYRKNKHEKIDGWVLTCLFTVRCTIVQSAVLIVHRAVLRLHVVYPSVCLSVCNVGGSASHKLEILETNCTDN